MKWTLHDVGVRWIDWIRVSLGLFVLYYPEYVLASIDSLLFDFALL